MQQPDHTDEEKEKENEPPKKKLKLSSPGTDNTIASGEKLSDLSINLAQQLLKKQFPSVNGLQSTLLQAKPRLGEPPNNQLQIVYSLGDH